MPEGSKPEIKQYCINKSRILIGYTSPKIVLFQFACIFYIYSYAHRIRPRS